LGFTYSNMYLLVQIVPIFKLAQNAPIWAIRALTQA
jgi:hypothetical protein